MHVIGKTGTGKTTLLETLIVQDIEDGRGVALIDPHGTLAERVYAYARTSGREDILYLNAADPETPYGYNPLRPVRASLIPLAVSGFLEVFKKRFADAWGVRMEHVLRNALYAIYESGGGTLSDVLALITDKDFRRARVKGIQNESVKTFWESEFPGYSDRYRVDSVAPIQNKLGAFLADPRMRRLVSTPNIDISCRKVMDRGGVLIVNLSRGQVGEDSASLLGALLVTTLSLAAYSRAAVPEDERRPFFAYIDEFHAFTTLAVAEMISELRKYRLALVMAHQHMHQLELGVQHALIGNAGTLIAFRLGAEDAALVSKEFMGDITTTNLISLANYEIALRLMVDGEPTRPFYGRTIRPEELAD
jgi:type IV secretory pathway TraG/TraD family ATPase VirD4